MREIKLGRAALVPGEQSAGRGVHARAKPGPPWSPPPQGPAVARLIPYPPTAHPAGLRPAPRMRPVPPLKGQCVPRVPSLPLQVASRTGVSVGFPGTPLSRRREAGAELRKKLTICQTMQTPGRFRARKVRGREFPKGSTSRGPSVLG